MNNVCIFFWCFRCRVLIVVCFLSTFFYLYYVMQNAISFSMHFVFLKKFLSKINIPIFINKFFWVNIQNMVHFFKNLAMFFSRYVYYISSIIAKTQFINVNSQFKVLSSFARQYLIKNLLGSHVIKIQNTE